LDVPCFYQASKALDAAVEFPKSILNVQRPHPELRKPPHIPPTENVDITTEIRLDTRKFSFRIALLENALGKGTAVQGLDQITW